MMIDLDAFTPSSAAFAVFCKSCDPWHTGRGLRDQRHSDMRGDTTRAPTLRRDEYLVILEFIVTHLTYIHPASAELANDIRARFTASKGVPNPYEIRAVFDDVGTVGHPLFVGGHKLLPTALETVFELSATADVCDELRRALRRFYSRVSRFYDKCHAETEATNDGGVRRGIRNTIPLSTCVKSAIVGHVEHGAVLAVRPCDVVVLVAAVWTRTAAREIKAPEFLRSILVEELNRICVFNHEDDRPAVVVGGADGVWVDDVFVTSSVAMASDQVRCVAFISPVRPVLRSFRIERVDDGADGVDASVGAFELSMQFGEMRDVVVSTFRDVMNRDVLNSVLTGYDVMVSAGSADPCGGADIDDDRDDAQPVQNLFKRRRPITDS